MVLRALTIILGLLLHWGISAQSVAIQSPDEFLPYPLGTRYTPHHLLVDYFRYVDQQSAKVRLIEYGRTYEHRPLIAAIITSEANMLRLEDLRINNLRRTGLVAGPVMPDGTVFVQLSYSVHGNEAAGAESSMAVLHDLVTGSAEIDAWLDKTVVILDPCQNPDGYARFSQWSNTVSANPPNPNPVAREHQESWPSGRSNHYQFDLNRDWAWLTQQESRARIAFYLQWMPHVLADIHEFTGEAPYYFPPAARPYHRAITPWQAEFQERIGRNHARHFDAKGWGYFTRERYDLFYPSYGDTYPMYSGAIGMTYEQGGGGFANLAIIRENGDTLTLADRLAHHRAASLSTLEISARHADRIVDEFESYYHTPASVTTYVMAAREQPGKIKALTALLDLHHIRYAAAAAPRKGMKGFAYRTGMSGPVDIREGDLVLSTAQPRGRLVDVLFEPQPALEDSLTYDITAWSLPFAYGLEAYRLDEELQVKAWPVADKAPRVMSNEPYAYALKWGSLDAVRMVAVLTRQGVVARYALESFSMGQQTYPAGTILLLQSDNRKNYQFHVFVENAIETYGVQTDRLFSGFVDAGKDFGSYSYPLLRAPRVLSISGESVSPYNAGEIWHYFEEEIKYPIDIVQILDFDGQNLQPYNIIILPEGYYSLSAETLGKLSAWMREGGTLIALGSANQKIAGKPGFDLAYKTNTGADSLKREEVAHTPDIFASEDRQAISEDIPGAIFSTVQDVTHPLTFGLGMPYFTLKTSPTAFAKLRRSGNAIWLADSPVHYGFAGYRAQQQMPSTLIAGRESRGAGQMVYLIDNPLFRSFWYDGKLLFANALFF